MKNKAPVLNESLQMKLPNWYEETQDDDFLSGKTPNDLQYTWEDEE